MLDVAKNVANALHGNGVLFCNQGGSDDPEKRQVLRQPAAAAAGKAVVVWDLRDKDAGDIAPNPTVFNGDIPVRTGQHYYNLPYYPDSNLPQECTFPITFGDYRCNETTPDPLPGAIVTWADGEDHGPWTGKGFRGDCFKYYDSYTEDSWSGAVMQDQLRKMFKYPRAEAPFLISWQVPYVFDGATSTKDALALASSILGYMPQELLHLFDVRYNQTGDHFLFDGAERNVSFWRSVMPLLVQYDFVEPWTSRAIWRANNNMSAAAFPARWAVARAALVGWRTPVPVPARPRPATSLTRLPRPSHTGRQLWCWLNGRGHRVGRSVQIPPRPGMVEWMVMGLGAGELPCGWVLTRAGVCHTIMRATVTAAAAESRRRVCGCSVPVPPASPARLAPPARPLARPPPASQAQGARAGAVVQLLHVHRATHVGRRSLEKAQHAAHDFAGALKVKGWQGGARGAGVGRGGRGGRQECTVVTRVGVAGLGSPSAPPPLHPTTPPLARLLSAFSTSKGSCREPRSRAQPRPPPGSATRARHPS